MWGYKPGEFLENGVNQSGPDFALSVEHGVAQAVLNQPLDPVPPDLIRGLRVRIQDILDSRQLLIHGAYQLDEHPRIVQHGADGRMNHVLMVGASAVKVKGNSADIIVRDANGNVVQDTKAERLAEHGRFIRAGCLAVYRSRVSSVHETGVRVALTTRPVYEPPLWRRYCHKMCFRYDTQVG
jgi:hypothetical protein